MRTKIVIERKDKPVGKVYCGNHALAVRIAANLVAAGYNVWVAITGTKTK